MPRDKTLTAIGLGAGVILVLVGVATRVLRDYMRVRDGELSAALLIGDIAVLVAVILLVGWYAWTRSRS